MKKIWGLLIILFAAFALIACKDKDDPDDPNNPDNPDDPNIPVEVVRENASYFVPGTPIIDDAYVVYINFDGFARYYFDALMEDSSYTPVLSQIMSEGVFFENLRTTLPSITNPLQNAILSGTTSKDTHNVYRYYDRTRNVVVQQARENDAPRITSLVSQAGITSASVSHYLAGEDGYSATDVSKLYVNVDNTLPSVVARGTETYGDHFARFEQAIKLIKGEPITTYSGGTPITLTDLPHFILLYCDDLDAIGHNESSHYGYEVADSEEGRLDNVVQQLKSMDQKLGELIQAAKDHGIYDQMTFFLTTDHGMTGFGDAVRGETSDYRSSKYGALREAIRSFDSRFNLEFVAAGNTPASTSNVVAVGMNLNLQLSWAIDVTDAELEALKTMLLQLDYVYDVKTRSDLEEMGYWTYAADMIIAPAERYTFSSSILSSYSVRAQHDSLQDSSNRVFGVIWGNGIKKDVVYEGEAYNYDFGAMMAAALGLQLPADISGMVLDIFEQETA